MKYNKHLLAAVVASSLIACGGGSSSSSVKTPDPVVVTESNISQAINIAGAEPVQTDIPETLSSTSVASVDQIIVSANSSFRLDLSVPQADIPSGKMVAGYLIELPDGTQQFVHTNAAAVVANASAAQVTKNVASSGLKSKHSQSYWPSAPVSATVAATQTTTGTASVVVSGWSSVDFRLDQSIANLTVRILPLFVNETIEDISGLTYEQVKNLEGFDITLVQELMLSVEAVATSTIQISLTWNTKTDVDLYVLEPGFVYTGAENETNLVSYFHSMSPTSLGWLDRDNTEAYGPENITFNYQMPVGEYQIAVNYFDGSVATDYTVTVTIADAEPVVLKGTFAADSSNYGNLQDDAGTDVVYTFTVDNALNSKLSPKVPLNQYLGVWQLPEESSVQGYMKVTTDGIAFFYSDATGGCYSGGELAINYFPTGFRLNGGLQVSDAFFNDWEGNDFSYAYRTLMKVDAGVISSCTPENIE